MPELGEALFLLEFFLMISWDWVPIGTWVMQLITPEIILKTYFKEPHFNRGELIIYQHFPASFVRTTVFMWGCFSQRLQRGRQLKGYVEVAPAWYQKMSKIVALSMLAHTIVMVGLLFFLWIMATLER